VQEIEGSPRVALFALSSAVFAERDGKILILKRAGGTATGTWYLPGGAVDPGETVHDSAIRELHEEAGLTPSGPLTCVGVAHMHVYGADSLQVLYACACPDGEVVLSHEHSGARWIDARDYRERFFTDDGIAAVAQADQRAGEMLRNIRDAIDAYLNWCALREAAS
jgi:8-oxo-dGTP pyrophosphatase MutT (NUDIX family)